MLPELSAPQLIFFTHETKDICPKQFNVIVSFPLSKAFNCGETADGLSIPAMLGKLLGSAQC